MAAEVLAAHPGMVMQTHLAETQDELRRVTAPFPKANSDVDVHEQAGLLGPSAVLAHGVWLSADDRARLSHCGAQALGLGQALGRIEPGWQADFAPWPWHGQGTAAVDALRQAHARSGALHERVFAWTMLGDERLLCASRVAGTCRYSAPTP